jgi:CrcB protein
MVEIFFVSLGSMLGANTRFEFQNKLEKFHLGNGFVILIINTFASFSLGLFLSILEKFSSFNYSYQLVLFFSIGFLGSLSTFSSFVYELFDLCMQLKFLKALKVSISSVSLGIISFAFGFLLVNQ